MPSDPSRAPRSLDSFGVLRSMGVGSKRRSYYSLRRLGERLEADVSRLPFSLRILLENLLRFEDGRSVTRKDIESLARWRPRGRASREISFRPARVLMQDFTGVPAMVDLAAMREKFVAEGGDADRVAPRIPVDLVIDHSVSVDVFARRDALRLNVAEEYRRNAERYSFLKWGAEAFANFRVVPPGAGICHQVNLERLGEVVREARFEKAEDKNKGKGKRKGKRSAPEPPLLFPDTLVGTDSHTTMINGLATLGWGTGGIEAEAAMLGQPISMLIPEVIGFRVAGRLPAGATSTDLVLRVTEMLRAEGAVGSFVEFCGPGLSSMRLEERATIANMAPEYGATCGFFPLDEETLRYLRATGRSPSRVATAEAYCRAQGLFRGARTPTPEFSRMLELDLSSVRPSIAGPGKPQRRVVLEDAADAFVRDLSESASKEAKRTLEKRYPVKGESFDLGHGDVVIAAITSCTNTSNPSVMIAAGLLARNAARLGLRSAPWTKTSLAPGSRTVTDYLKAAGLDRGLDALGFRLVGYGCTTCIGNSGPLPPSISETLSSHDLTAASVLSGNRNFEGRIHPQVRANYLASPPLVVAYALAGSMRTDLSRDPLGHDRRGRPVYLRDVWPSESEISATSRRFVKREMFRRRYAEIFRGDSAWRSLKPPKGSTYAWDGSSTYIRKPDFFSSSSSGRIVNARILGLFDDGVTTDHISPAGSIASESPAGRYLSSRKVGRESFNSYGSRRGNHEVMMRGTFANVRIRNRMRLTEGIEGGFSAHHPSGDVSDVFSVARRYCEEGIPLVIFAGREYGTGSSRDWAAKGTRLLGVRAVIAESFERIHRSNLIGMGVLPLEFESGTSWRSLRLEGDETVTIESSSRPSPKSLVSATLRRRGGKTRTFRLLCRIDTVEESSYYFGGGILPYVLSRLAA